MTNLYIAAWYLHDQSVEGWHFGAGEGSLNSAKGVTLAQVQALVASPEFAATVMPAWERLHSDTGLTSVAMFNALVNKLSAYGVTVTSKDDVPNKLDDIKTAFNAELNADTTALQAAGTFAPYKTACNAALLHVRNQNDIRDLIIGILARQAAGR